MVDEQPELHDLTKMLLKRMESNPEEFFITSGYKWRKAVETVREHGPKHDKDVLNAAIHKLQMDAGLRDALKVLLAVEEEKPVGGGFTQNQTTLTGLATQYTQQQMGQQISDLQQKTKDMIFPPTRSSMEVERDLESKTVLVKYPDGNTFVLNEMDLYGSPLTKALISYALGGSK